MVGTPLRGVHRLRVRTARSRRWTARRAVPTDVAAGIHLGEALARGLRLRLERPRQFESSDSRRVDGRLLQRLLTLLEPLPEHRDAFRSGIGLRRRERRDVVLLGPGRWIRTVEADRQPLVEVQDRRRDPALPHVQRHPELDRLAVEVLLVGFERRQRGRVEQLLGDLRAVHEEADPHRHRTIGTLAIHEHADQVGAGNGDPVTGVRRVGQAQPADVVLSWRCANGRHGSRRRLQADDRRSLRFVPEHRRPDDLLRGDHVLLEQHRRQRQHVGDVVEAIPGIVLREVVGGTHVDAEEIADGVVVFGPIEAARGDAARVGRRDALEPVEFLLDPACDRLDVLRVGPLLVLRRHLAGPELEQHVLDVVDVHANRVGAVETLEVHPALLPAIVVAVGAVLLEEGLDDGVERGAIGLPVGRRRARRRRGSQRGHGHEQQGEGATHGVPGIVARRAGWPSRRARRWNLGFRSTAVDNQVAGPMGSACPPRPQ